jgi:hypothetical protein
MTSQKYPVNKPLRLAGIGYIVLFILFVISKSFLPQRYGGWSDPPLYDYFYLAGTGICIFVLTLTYTYYSWKLDAKDHYEWLKSQRLVKSRIDMSNYPETYALWSMRLFSPVGVLIGALLVIFMSLKILNYFFG